MLIKETLLLCDHRCIPTWRTPYLYCWRARNVWYFSRPFNERIRRETHESTRGYTRCAIYLHSRRICDKRLILIRRHTNSVKVKTDMPDPTAQSTSHPKKFRKSLHSIHLNPGALQRINPLLRWASIERTRCEWSPEKRRVYTISQEE